MATQIKVTSSTAAYCTAELDGRGKHDPDDKFEIVKGRGFYKPGMVICAKCVPADSEARQAITNYRTAVRKAGNQSVRSVEEPPKVDRHGRRMYTWPELYWPWLAVLGAIVVGWGYRTGVLVFLFAGAAVLGFAFWSPNRCLAPVDDDPTRRCLNWGHGVFRGCAEEWEHRKLRNDAWIAFFRHGVWDRQVWASRQGFGAWIGLAASILLLFSTPIAWYAGGAG